jgi:hypothetical protein
MRQNELFQPASQSVCEDYGSADPDPKEVFTYPQWPKLNAAAGSKVKVVSNPQKYKKTKLFRLRTTVSVSIRMVVKTAIPTGTR